MTIYSIPPVIIILQKCITEIHPSLHVITQAILQLKIVAAEVRDRPYYEIITNLPRSNNLLWRLGCLQTIASDDVTKIFAQTAF